MAVLDRVFFGPFCSLFCTGMSVFGILTLLTLGTLIKNEYAYTGVHFHDGEARATTASGCFTAAAAYFGFLIWAVLSIFYNKRRKKL
mmetsp:Transcript_11209/g.23553  ORF Transcript_11209/g.23553 Transcript_11209/m.23553 type:complete len:87 (+) Transcript_11209:131-391(+)